MPRAVVELALNASLFQRGIAAAEGTMTRFARAARRVGGLVSGALGAIGVGLSVGALASGVKRVLEMGDSLAEMHDRTGIAVKDLVILRQSFEDASLSAEDVGTSIGKMQKAIIDGSKGFDDLGLKTKRLLDLGPAEQFAQIGKSIMAIENPAKRAAVAIEVFGKAGAKLLPIFASGLGNSKQLEWQALAFEKNAEAFGRVADKMKNVGLATRGFFIGVAEAALPKIEEVLNRFDAVNWEQKGKDFAKGIGTGISMLERTKGWLDKADEKMDKAVPFGSAIAPLAGLEVAIRKLPAAVMSAAKSAAAGIELALRGMPTAPKLTSPIGAPLIPFGGAVPPKLPAPLAFLGPKPDSAFWKQPDPRLQFGANTGPLQNNVSKVNPFMSPSDAARVRSEEFMKRFPQARRDQAFTDRFRGSPEALEAWGEKMGIKGGAGEGVDKPYKSGGYHYIRSRSREEREAAKAPKKDKVEATIADKSMNDLATKVANKIEEKVP